jgi:hypothetical protein
LAWLLIALSVWGANWALSSGSAWLAIAGVGACWLVVVNRGRCLQATFHYMTHGSAMPAGRWAELVATLAFTTPFFYEGWRSYVGSHVTTHHHLRVLCSADDPDQRFIESNGLHPGIGEASYWLRVWAQPFAPRFLLGQLILALKATLVEPTWAERWLRLSLLGAAAAWAISAGWWDHGLLLFGIPAWLLFRHSLWLQLITEHLWFAPRGLDAGTPAAYGRLTWGRFQGRALPQGGVLALTRWCAALLLCDLPVRLYVYPQDLPNHDFHHRLPIASYARIADLRRTCENEMGRFGPCCEVWGFLATLRLVRDHLCYGQSLPFFLPPSHQLRTPST